MSHQYEGQIIPVNLNTMFLEEANPMSQFAHTAHCETSTQPTHFTEVEEVVILRIYIDKNVLELDVV